MSATLLRGVLLCAACALSIASSPQSQSSPPPSYPAGAGGGSGYYCHTVRSSVGNSSLCFASNERCERERQTAAADGLSTSYCGQLSPVACFQLGGDANPSQELCAGSIDDCELWRQIDRDKNGDTGEACALRH